MSFSTAISKKDIIRINQEIGESGEMQNESSLDFALSTMKHRKSWLYELSYMARCLLADHAFMDGNKRTALVLIITCFKEQNIGYDKDALVKTIWEISKKNIADINKIARMIKDAAVY